MNKQTLPIVIESLTLYTPRDMEAIQHLLAQLSNRFENYIISSGFIDEIIASPYHDILVARESTTRTIIGCVTLSITFGTGAGRKAWIDDFITDSNAQGMGVGSQLWNEMLAWAHRHGATTLQFTSSDKHKAAHSFYLKRGAVIRDTNFFKKSIE